MINCDVVVIPITQAGVSITPVSCSSVQVSQISAGVQINTSTVVVVPGPPGPAGPNVNVSALDDGLSSNGAALRLDLASLSFAP